MSLGLVSLVGIVVLSVLGLGLVRLVGAFGSALFRGSDGSGTGARNGPVTLSCPHCGHLTRANRHVCEHCSQDL